MDYTSYFATPQQYPFMSLPTKPEHPYTPQDDISHDPIVRVVHGFAPFHWKLTRDVKENYNHNPNRYSTFGQSFDYAPNQIIAHPQSPPHSLHRTSLSNAIPRESSHSNELSGDLDGYDQGQGRSSDDDKDNLTPAQSRRKAQNRAA